MFVFVGVIATIILIVCILGMIACLYYLVAADDMSFRLGVLVTAIFILLNVFCIFQLADQRNNAIKNYKSCISQDG